MMYYLLHIFTLLSNLKESMLFFNNIKENIMSKIVLVKKEIFSYQK